MRMRYETVEGCSRREPAFGPPGQAGMFNDAQQKHIIRESGVLNFWRSAQNGYVRRGVYLCGAVGASYRPQVPGDARQPEAGMLSMLFVGRGATMRAAGCAAPSRHAVQDGKGRRGSVCLRVAVGLPARHVPRPAHLQRSPVVLNAAMLRWR